MLSVLLPFRDAAPTLAAAVESVLAERDVDLELVAVDDGSSDDGAAIVERIARDDARVRLVRGPARGIAQALNCALGVARGDVIARMDADDESLPGRFAAQLSRLSRGDVSVVGTQVEAFPAGVVEQGMQRYVGWSNAIVEPHEHAREIFVESPLCHPSVVMRRDALEAVAGYRDVDLPEDYDLWLRMHGAGHRFAKVPRVLLRWRHHAARATLRDPRYSLDRFPIVKAPFLAAELRARGRPLTIWGAGKTGKRLARALEAHDVCAARFVDIDPRKLGGIARGAPIVDASTLRRGSQTVVVAVGARGAREIVRDRLRALGFVEGDDFVCAS